MTLVLVTAYHSFSVEVEASNTPTIRRLTPSCHHQLPRIAGASAPNTPTGLGCRLLSSTIVTASGTRTVTFNTRGGTALHYTITESKNVVKAGLNLRWSPGAKF